MCCSGVEHQRFIGRRLDHPQGLWPERKPGITTSIFRCRVCGLIYANPLPIPEDLGQHYEVAPEDYWTEAHFVVPSDYMVHQVRTFERLTKRAPRDSTALDIGVGLGKAMVALQEAGFDTHGIEPSASFRRAAIERKGISPDALSLVSIEDSDFPPDSFDFINFMVVLEHLVDPASVLRKVVRWLKPSGLLHVEVPSSAFLLTRLVRVFYRLTGANFSINASPLHPPYHLYEFGLESFIKHGPAAGYIVTFHEYYPSAVDMPAGYMPRWLVPYIDKVMKWTDTGMQLAVWLRKE
jgi:SAM-dependent methyltransferase